MGQVRSWANQSGRSYRRMISLALRAGVDIIAIIDQLKGIRCPAPFLVKVVLYYPALMLL
jgi:hypothetical protein